MLIERNQVLVGIIAAVVIAAGTTFALFASAGAFVAGHRVTAYFSDAAGLSPGDQVRVAGIRAGQVDRVTIEGNLARVDFRVDADLPADSLARITVQNVLGRRMLLVVPGTSWDELLRDGSVIPAERTATPVDMPEFGEQLGTVLEETDRDALQGLVTALADVTEGQRDEVAALLDGVERLTAVISERREELRTVIERGGVIVDAMADRDTELVRMIDGFSSTLDRLAQRRSELERLLSETARATTTAADLLDEERLTIDRVLRRLHEDLTIVDRHQVDLAHAFAYGGVAFQGFAEIGRSGEVDNPYWANMFVTSLGPLGVDAIFGCGGAMDQVLDELFGPDPRPCEEAESDAAPRSAAERGSVRSLFVSALTHGAAR